MSRFVASHRTSQSVRWKKDHYAFDRHRRFADVFAQLVAMAWLLVLGSSTGAPDQRMLPVIPMLVLIVICRGQKPTRRRDCAVFLHDVA